MNQFLANKTFFSQPYLLSKEQMENPGLVICQFFEDVHLIESRQYLREMLRTIMTGGLEAFDEADTRCELWNYMERLELLIEAVWLIKSKN